MKIISLLLILQAFSAHADCKIKLVYGADGGRAKAALYGKDKKILTFIAKKIRAKGFELLEETSPEAASYTLDVIVDDSTSAYGPTNGSDGRLILKKNGSILQIANGESAQNVPFISKTTKPIPSFDRAALKHASQSLFGGWLFGVAGQGSVERCE